MPRLEVKEAAQFQDHFSTVWRVTWNVTGTILASTGDDGFIRMWKSKISTLIQFIFYLNKHLFIFREPRKTMEMYWFI